jgi:hypothetical protein
MLMVTHFPKQPAERTVEKIEIHDEERTKELPLTQIVPEIEVNRPCTYSFSQFVQLGGTACSG